MSPSHISEILIAGAGASGLFCAFMLSRMGHRPILLEAGARCGRKLAISGGGRANFSNLNMDSSHYRCRPDTDFCEAVLSAFPVADMLELLRAWRLPYEEREHGRLFLRAPASRLVASLRDACLARGCSILCGQKIMEIRHNSGIFRISSQRGQWQAKNLVLALGSPACPQAGASAAGFKFARMLGHRVNPPKAALVPMLYGKELHNELRGLCGISLQAAISVKVPGEQNVPPLPVDDLLFTHAGISGPAMLQASLYWRPGAEIQIDFLPGGNFEKMLDESPRSTPRALLRHFLAPRLADALLPPAHLAGRKNAELGRGQRQTLARAVHCYKVPDLHPDGLKKAEVCSGGMAVDELNPQTMESRILPHLWSCGELLDVTGQLGGYNLHWAFASAARAARAIARCKAGFKN